MAQKNHFLFINEVYFGATYDGSKPDKTRDYLSKDFGRVLYGLIQHDVLTHVLSHNPEKYATLANIRETFDHGLVVNLRKLVKKERAAKKGCFVGEPGSCTGGDFIEDLYRLKKEDLDEIIISTREFEDKLADLFFSNADKTFLQLQDKVRSFKDKNYYERLVKANEGVGLHKDHQPVKRKVVKRETIYEPNCPFHINKTTYRSRFSLEVQEVAKCLNELAEIIYLYQSIMFSRGVCFFVSHDYYLKPYIERCFAMFGSLEDFTSEINTTAQSIIKSLEPSLKVGHWSYE